MNQKIDARIDVFAKTPFHFRFDDKAPPTLILAYNFGDLAPALGDRVLHTDDPANVQLPRG